MDASNTSWRGELVAKLSGEVSSRSLALVRIAVGFAIWDEFTSPWVAHRMDDVGGVMALAWVVLLAVWLVIFGLGTRWATVTMALAFAGLHLYYGVHLGDAKLAAPVQEFQLVVLLAITPCGRSLSIDRALEVRRARKQGRAPAPELARTWHLDLFVILAASAFFWLGVGGTDSDWLSGEWLVRDVAYWYGSDMLAAHPGLPALCKTAAWTLTISEFVVAGMLLPRRLRSYAMGLGLALVFVNMLVMAHTFAAFYDNLILMVCLTACAPAAWVHAFISDQSAQVRHEATGGQAARAPSGSREVSLAVLALATMIIWSNIPPYRGHVLDQPRHMFAWAWSLHQPATRQACDLRYYDMNQGGALIERWKLLGYESPGAVPDKLSRVSKPNLHASTVGVCKALRKAGDGQPNVELDARCVIEGEWVAVAAREGSLCWSAKKGE